MKHCYRALLGLCICLMAGCSSRKQVKPAIELGASSIFSQEELEDAAEELVDEFSDEWQDCVLVKVVYRGDEASQRKAEYYGHEKGIDFLIDFTTNSDTEALNPNSKYEEYQFFLAYKDGKWIVDYAACGYG